MRPSDEIDPAVGEAAARWLAQRDREFSPTEARAFEAWCDADPRHRREFARLEREWKSFELAAGDAELADEARQLAAATGPVAQRRRWFFRAGGIGLAAALAVAGIFGWRTKVAPAAPAVASYQVVPGTARELRLPDGSLVELRGESAVTADYTPTERRVQLVRGEAHFVVAKNPARPFIVQVGGVAVRAVGTAFNVRLESAAVDVLVTEGRVRVERQQGGQTLLPAADTAETPVLAAGERITVGLEAGGAAATGPVVALAPVEIDQALAWQRTRLVFNRTPLAEAVAAFSRHGAQRIELGDDRLRDQLLGGTFRTDNVEGFVRLLEQGGGIRVERRADGTLVLHDGR